MNGGFDLNGRSVLLVEDQLLIALDAEAMLEEIGAGDIVTAASVEDALRAIENSTPDIAILDINLGSKTSMPIAEVLARQQVPFIFATGYGDSQMVPDHLRHVPTARKPYSAASLRETMGDLLAPESRDSGIDEA